MCIYSGASIELNLTFCWRRMLKHLWQPSFLGLLVDDVRHWTIKNGTSPNERWHGHPSAKFSGLWTLLRHRLISNQLITPTELYSILAMAIHGNHRPKNSRGTITYRVNGIEKWINWALHLSLCCGWRMMLIISYMSHTAYSMSKRYYILLKTIASIII